MLLRDEGLVIVLKLEGERPHGQEVTALISVPAGAETETFRGGRIGRRDRALGRAC
jgi:hypothetical protein